MPRHGWIDLLLVNGVKHHLHNICGHELLSIIMHFVQILLSTLDPVSNIVFALFILYLCHKSLSIFVHCVPNLLSVRDPASLVLRHRSGFTTGRKQNSLLANTKDVSTYVLTSFVLPVWPRGESKLTVSVPVVAILFRKAHNLAGNSFDSHVNLLLAGLLA